MNKYTIEKDELGFGKQLSINTNWNESFIKMIDKKQISSLKLSFSNGWKDSDVSFIKDIKTLKSIEIYSWKVNDLSPLYSLHDLQFIGVQVDLKKKFDLSIFNQLKKLNIVFNSKVKKIAKCKHLEEINVVNYPNESFEIINNLRRLNRIQITSKKLKTTEGVTDLKHLETLDFYNCSKLESLNELGTITNLKHIFFSKCKQLNTLDELMNNVNLESIILEDCGELASLNFIQNCKKLKRLIIIGATSIRDDDLSIIKSMPNLEEVRIRNVTFPQNSTR